MVKTECGNSILEFDSQSEYDDVYDCLLQECNAWDDSIEARFGYLTDEDQYNDTLDFYTINEEQPLIDFETAKGFQSYRTKFDTIEAQWLAAGADDNVDPDSTNCIDDPIAMTLLSWDGAIKIGNVLNYVSPSCGFYTVTNGDCNLLQQLIDNGGHVNDSNITSLQIKAASGDCRTDEQWHRSVPYNQGGLKKVKRKHAFKYFWFNGEYRARAVQKCYRKVLGLFWRKARLNQEVYINGSTRQFNCPSNYLPYSDFQIERKARLVVWEPIAWSYENFLTCEVEAQYIHPHGNWISILPSSACQ